jgi:hypothetical protein
MSDVAVAFMEQGEGRTRHVGSSDWQRRPLSTFD